MKISHEENYDNLQNNIKKLKSLIKMLNNECEISEKIKEYCSEKKRLTQLSTEQRINEINYFNDELIKIIQEYERKS